MPICPAERRQLSAADELVLDKRLEPASIRHSLVLAVALIGLLASPCLVHPAMAGVVRVATVAFGG